MDGEPVEIEAWSEDQCQKFIDDYYKLYPEIRDYQQEMVAMARRLGYVRDPISGRIRYIPEVTCPVRSVAEAGARMAANFPVTTSAQIIIKAAMGRLWRELPKTGWRDKVRWEMQIHDSLIVELDDDSDFIREYVAWQKHIMCDTISLSVPVDVDFKIGRRWGEMTKMKLD